jgi:hypothetical protein
MPVTVQDGVYQHTPTDGASMPPVLPTICLGLGSWSILALVREVMLWTFDLPRLTHQASIVSRAIFGSP